MKKKTVPDHGQGDKLNPRITASALVPMLRFSCRREINGSGAVTQRYLPAGSPPAMELNPISASHIVIANCQLPTPTAVELEVPFTSTLVQKLSPHKSSVDLLVGGSNCDLAYN